MDWTVGRWRVRMGQARDDLRAALDLRARVFRGGADDRDVHDASAQHLLIEAEGGLRGYARLWPQSAGDLDRGYSARFYDMTPIAARHARAVEIGRVCFAGDDPELPRVLLAALTEIVDRTGASLLYGCASFDPGEEASLGHLAPRLAQAGPGRRAPEIVDIPAEGRGALPTLLRLYLGFGAEVSDHAVRDRDLGTLHVLAMLPLSAIPPARVRALRALVPQPSER